MKKLVLLTIAALAIGLVFSAGMLKLDAQKSAGDDLEWMPSLGDEDGPPYGQGMGQGAGNGNGRRGMGQAMGQGMRLRDGSGAGEGTGPAAGMGRGRGRGGRMVLEKIKREDPARYEDLMKIKKLSEEYKATDDKAKKAKIEKELRPLVDKELKIQQKQHEERIEKLEKKLAQMKSVLKQREDNWDKVVDYTVSEITGQNDYLKAWPGGGWRR